LESLTRLVTDSLARHGFDRPVDPRRLQWSRWSRCDSPHSLLVVPSKPGIFAIAEEVMDLGTAHVGTDAFVRPAEQRSAAGSAAPTDDASKDREGHDFSPEPALSKQSAPKGAASPNPKAAASAADQLLGEQPLGGAALQRCDSLPGKNPALAAEVRRMLAVLQFSEDDDMAFTLDRMFTQVNPMRARFATGRCFLRFVVIEDQAQRRSICSALNQWLLSSAEKASGLPADFQSSLEFTRVGRTLLSDNTGIPESDWAASVPKSDVMHSAPPQDSGANENLHCPHPLPSGF